MRNNTQSPIEALSIKKKKLLNGPQTPETLSALYDTSVKLEALVHPENEFCKDVAECLEIIERLLDKIFEYVAKNAARTVVICDKNAPAYLREFSDVCFDFGRMNAYTAYTYLKALGYNANPLMEPVEISSVRNVDWRFSVSTRR